MEELLIATESNDTEGVAEKDGDGGGRKGVRGAKDQLKLTMHQSGLRRIEEEVAQMHQTVRHARTDIQPVARRQQQVALTGNIHQQQVRKDTPQIEKEGQIPRASQRGFESRKESVVVRQR